MVNANQTKEFAESIGLSSEDLNVIAKGTLNNLEYRIFKKRLEGRTLEDIGNKFCAHRERIRQKETEIIQKIKKRKQNKEFETGLVSEYGALIRYVSELKSKAKIIEDYEDKELPDILQTRIDGLELSVRASNCLKYAKMETLSDLVQKTDMELLQYPGLGRGTLCELAELVLKYGLNFGINIEEYKQTASKYVINKKDLDDVYQRTDGLLNKIMNIRLENLELPSPGKTRILNTARGANIETLGDLVQKTEVEMMQYPNFGGESLDTLKSLLKGYGLSFGMNVEKVGEKYVLKK